MVPDIAPWHASNSTLSQWSSSRTMLIWYEAPRQFKTILAMISAYQMLNYTAEVLLHRANVRWFRFSYLSGFNPFVFFHQTISSIVFFLFKKKKNILCKLHNGFEWLKYKPPDRCVGLFSHIEVARKMLHFNQLWCMLFSHDLWASKQLDDVLCTTWTETTLSRWWDGKKKKTKLALRTIIILPK